MRDERLLCLVRHGETEGESSIRYHGRNDVPLSEEGRRQVRRLAPLLEGYRFAAVVCSPLRRARESAEILRAGLPPPRPVLEVEPGLTEVDFGRIEGLTDAEIAAALPDWHRAWRAGRTEGYPGGETLEGFRARVAAAFDAILARRPSGDLLVVCHRGVIKYGVVHLCGWSEEAAARVAPPLGSLTIVRHGPEPGIVRLGVSG